MITKITTQEKVDEIIKELLKREVESEERFTKLDEMYGEEIEKQEKRRESPTYNCMTDVGDIRKNCVWDRRYAALGDINKIEEMLLMFENFDGEISLDEEDIRVIYEN